VQVDPRDMWPVIRRPMWLLRVTIAMFVAVPILAVILAKTFHIPNVMRGAMVLLAISAAAPLLPGKLLKLGDDLTHDATLAAVTSVLAILLVPLALKGLGVAFQRDVGITVAAVAAVLMTTFLLPLGIGMVARAVLGPARAVRIGELAGDAGDIVLGILVLLMVVAQRATVFPLLWQSMVVIALFAAGALAIGHLLGGPVRGSVRPWLLPPRRGIPDSRCLWRPRTFASRRRCPWRSSPSCSARRWRRFPIPSGAGRFGQWRHLRHSVRQRTCVSGLLVATTGRGLNTGHYRPAGR
jgi:BASS family bile acid:Na+ symporter